MTLRKRRIDERATVRVGVLETPLTLLRRRLAVRTWHAVHNEAKGLTADVGVDAFDDANHVPPSPGLRRDPPMRFA